MQIKDHFVKIEYLQYTQFLINNIYVNTFFSGQGFGITQNSTDAKNTLFNINKKSKCVLYRISNVKIHSSLLPRFIFGDHDLKTPESTPFKYVFTQVLAFLAT